MIPPLRLRSIGFARLVLTVAAPALWLVPSTALAGDPAAAQALFDDASRLMSQRRLAEACPKFDESQRQDPGIGTLYHYADCEDRLGKTATAWATFLEVAAEANAQGEAARATAAKERASALESRLARLTIDPGAEAATPGLQLFRDGEPIGKGQWSTSIPVDPGSHVIEARAPGKGKWTSTVSTSGGSRLVVTVPLLADVGSARQASDEKVATTTTTSAETPVGHSGRGQRITGAVLSALGVAGLGVGGYFGIDSILRHRDSDSHCVGNVCDATGVSQRSDAQQAGTAATVALGAGGAVLLAGILTYATAPREPRDPLANAQSSFRAQVAVGPGSLSLQGSW
jgi:hypothetical protein